MTRRRDIPRIRQRKPFKQWESKSKAGARGRREKEREKGAREAWRTTILRILLDLPRVERQGDRLANAVEQMQEMQREQTQAMTGFLAALTKAIEKN